MPSGDSATPRPSSVSASRVCPASSKFAPSSMLSIRLLGVSAGPSGTAPMIGEPGCSSPSSSACSCGAASGNGVGTSTVAGSSGGKSVVTSASTPACTSPSAGATGPPPATGSSASGSEAGSGSATGSRTGSRSGSGSATGSDSRSEEHTSELQSRGQLVCRLLLEKKKQTTLTAVGVAIPTPGGIGSYHLEGQQTMLARKEAARV